MVDLARDGAALRLKCLRKERDKEICLPANSWPRTWMKTLLSSTTPLRDAASRKR